MVLNSIIYWIQLVLDPACSRLSTLSSSMYLHCSVLVFLKVYSHNFFFKLVFFDKNIGMKT